MTGYPDERGELRSIFDPADQDTSLTFRIEYSDGRSSSTADTIALRYAATEAPGTPPPPPPTLVPVGGSGAGNADAVEVHQPLWMSPLPPAEPFMIGVDWPAYGIRHAVLHLDGAEIVAAAGAVRGYWEDDLA